jgi:hypothetical protein
MKKSSLIFSLLLALFVSGVSTACSRKSGCPATESLMPKSATKTKKNGEVKSKKRPEAGLFPNSVNKKLR